MKTKRVLSYILTALLAFALGIFALACVIRPRTLELSEPDLSAVEDGEYIGVCQNKLLFAAVRVRVTDHELRGVELLYHKPSYLAQAQEAARRVAQAGTLQVDAVSGATLTSDTVRKAVENALTAAAVSR